MILPIVQGATVEEVTAIYNQRAVNPEGFANARKAIEIAEAIGKQNANAPEIAAAAFFISCKSYFFLGDFQPGPRSEKKQDYQKGYLACKQGIGFIEETRGQAKKPEWNDLLADLYFFYTANLGRWFEDESKFQALKYWRNEVKPLLDLLIEKMGKQAIFAYGPARAMGKAYFEIPGGRPKSLRYLKEAYENTLHKTLKVSVWPLNTAYYAEALIAMGDKVTAKKILEDTIKVADTGKVAELHDQGYQEFKEYRMAETVEEINLCREIFNGIL
jgi:hypothetical protein